MEKPPRDGPPDDFPLTKEVAKLCPFSSRQMLPLFLLPRWKLEWWKINTANQFVLETLSQGVCQDWPCLPLPLVVKQKSFEDQEACLEIMREYFLFGAVKRVSWSQVKFLVPWFVIRKREETGKEKLRLIADCRLLNKFLAPRHFKLNN